MHKLTLGILKFGKVNSCKNGAIFVDAKARNLANEMLPRIYRGYPRRAASSELPSGKAYCIHGRGGEFC